VPAPLSPRASRRFYSIGSNPSRLMQRTTTNVSERQRTSAGMFCTVVRWCSSSFLGVRYFTVGMLNCGPDIRSSGQRLVTAFNRV
jgi:hypothetical protein